MENYSSSTFRELKSRSNDFTHPVFSKIPEVTIEEQSDQLINASGQATNGTQKNETGNIAFDVCTATKLKQKKSTSHKSSKKKYCLCKDGIET